MPVHGVTRTTVDVAIVPDPDRRNLERLRLLLLELAAHVPGADPQSDPLSIAALSSGATVKCFTRLGELHVVQDQPGVPSYADLRAGSLSIEVEGVEFRVCSYADLVAMKTASGRPQDEIDVTDLRRARGEID